MFRNKASIAGSRTRTSDRENGHRDECCGCGRVNVQGEPLRSMLAYLTTTLRFVLRNSLLYAAYSETIELKSKWLVVVSVNRLKIKLIIRT